MKLIERDDFDQWVIATADQTGLPEAFIEKDYYVTEALRCIVAAHPGAIVFKGGTSLSKGWRILDRFSEDLDLLVRPDAFTPAWTSKNQMEKGLRRVCAVVGDVPGLTPVPERAGGSRPKRRSEFFAFDARFADFPGIEAGLYVEPGIGSGDWPTIPRRITSYLADAIESAGDTSTVATDDLAPFDVEALSLGRTFVEKMYIAHAAVERHRAGTETIGRRVRHFADLAILVDQADVRALLDDPNEYARIVTDVDRATREWYGPVHLPPSDLRFGASSVFIPDDVFSSIEETYRRECDRLFFGRAYPSLHDGQERLAAVRHQL